MHKTFNMTIYMKTDEPLNMFYASQNQSQERMFFLDDYILNEDVNMRAITGGCPNV